MKIRSGGRAVKKAVKVAVVLVIWLVLIGSYVGFYFWLSQADVVQIPIRKDIEYAISAKGLGNKLVSTGGISLNEEFRAKNIATFSIQQFTDLVPENESIYVSLSRHYSTVKKVYWTPTKDRSGLIFYEDVYQLDNRRVKSYTEDAVFFHYDLVGGLLGFAYLLAGGIGGLGVLKLSKYIIMRN